MGAGILVAFIGIKIAGLYNDYNNGDTYKHGNRNLFRRLDKDNIASQSTVSLVIGTGNICRDKMVCERMKRSKRISLKQKYRYFIVTICIYFRANIALSY